MLNFTKSTWQYIFIGTSIFLITFGLLIYGDSQKIKSNNAEMRLKLSSVKAEIKSCEDTTYNLNEKLYQLTK